MGTCAAPDDHRAKRILVIDDDVATREAVHNALTRSDAYDVVLAAGGREALDLLDRERFDLVVCDIIMADVDGLEVIRYIRERMSDLPIIAISGGGRISPSDYLRIGIAFGAEKSMIKPLRIGELRDAVATLVCREAH